MIGLDVTHQALMTKADAERLRGTGRTGTLVAELWEFYNRFHSQTYGFDGSPIHDAVALAHVFRPDLVETEHRHVEIDCASDLCRGRTVVDLWRRTGNEQASARRANSETVLVSDDHVGVSRQDVAAGSLSSRAFPWCSGNAPRP